MSRSAKGASVNKGNKILDFVAENRIRLDALELVLKQTNPPLYELYLEEIEDLRKQKGERVAQDLQSDRS